MQKHPAEKRLESWVLVKRTKEKKIIKVPNFAKGSKEIRKKIIDRNRTKRKEIRKWTIIARRNKRKYMRKDILAKQQKQKRGIKKLTIQCQSNQNKSAYEPNKCTRKKLKEKFHT